MVRKSSTVILSLRGSGFWTGCLSLKKGVIRASTPGSIFLSMAMPTNMPVTVLVAERVLRNVSEKEALRYLRDGLREVPPPVSL